ncbi:2,3-diketo-L-gulonate-binding periplasmic protein YiaO precursor [Pelagimonas phthalicica]|uniref:2,3-diketo-L-gulonate-binding periplasmic protein YiaO n=1 Tax=Pelagimonas phthalicica TaxID=1037362 RepID=A0A238JG78_9RHOB|nr:TRAP transporter substrate-binding protein [Pelagimonas phthalicica]TDS92148.1 TRAP-type C4-dicarboxylate transport system substrate-binding protein [Pelagimonas phthalicica]SMX29204.1 2,3-diketo-L-gulonate-binding periplasmic protein YiaO precursor [Pelagimonas phthalicica]
MKLAKLSLVAMLALATTATAEVKIALDSKPDLETSGSYNWAHTFGKVLTEAGMEVREMPRGSVGNEAEKFDQISTGLLEVSLSDVRAVAQVDPFIYGVRLPYIFDDIAHMDRTLDAGKVFDRVNENLAKQDAVLLSLAPLGPSSGVITTKAVVRSPADMSDLRMRALDDAQIAMYKAWGSSGTIVPWGEVPAGLQTGVIDGYLNSPFVPVMFGQTDFVKNFSDAGVIIPLRAVIVSKLWYDGLSADERSTVDAAVEAADAATREWLAAASVRGLTSLEEKGVTVQRLTAEERAVFREASKPVYDSGLMASEDIQIWTSLSDGNR